MTRALNRTGRLVPSTAKRLRARVVRLRPGARMPWHTTDTCEEILVILEGGLRVARRTNRHPGRAIRLRAGQSLFLPSRTWHEVTNDGRRVARYLYVTG